MISMNKKGDGGLTAIIIILIVIIFLGWLVKIGDRECSSNKECNDKSYCGSDFNCHEYPAIQENTVQVSLTLPILLVCITAIALAIIFRWEKMFGKRASKNKESSEAYYESQVEESN